MRPFMKHLFGPQIAEFNRVLRAYFGDEKFERTKRRFGNEMIDFMLWS
jgi:hypothetical protein